MTFAALLTVVSCTFPNRAATQELNPFQTKLEPAYRFSFLTEPGRLYQVEVDSGLTSWSPAGAPVVGNGERVAMYFDQQLREFFRVTTDVAPANLQPFNCGPDVATSVVDSSSQRMNFPDLDRAPDGSFGIAYVNRTSDAREIRYAEQTDTGWIHELVSETNEFDRPHLEIGSDGNPRIAFKSGAQEWSIATRQSDTWVTDVISAAQVITSPSFLSLHPELQFAAYTNGVSNGLALIEEVGDEWNFEEINSTNAATPIKLVEKPGGQKILVARHSGANALTVLHQGESGWAQTTLPYNPSGTFYERFDVAVGISGDVLITAPLRRNSVDNGYRLLFAKESDGWAFEEVQTEPGFNSPNFSDPQIIVNPQGQKIIGYLHSREARMAVENASESDWKQTIVGRPRLPLTNANISGLSIDLTIDGHPVFAYVIESQLTFVEVR